MTGSSKPVVSNVDRRHRLLVRQRLTAKPSVGDGDVSVPTAVARSVVALHSSDPVSVYLSVLSRSPGATVDSVSNALYEDREMVRVHGMRRTLWVADVETGGEIVAASAHRLVTAERRRLATFLEGAGVPDPDAWIDDAASEILAHVADVGLTDTRAIGEELPHLALSFDVATGKKYAGTISAHSRILLLLGYQGHILRAAPLGTWIASQYRWAEPVSWLGRPLVADTDGTGSDRDGIARGQAAIIERYLRSFGPVTTDDVVWWTGWPKGAVGKALAAIGAIEVTLDDGTGWLAADDDGMDMNTPVEELDTTVALLPALDPTTMGWRERDHYLDPAMTARLFDRNGNVGPTIWVGGRIVGGWAQRDDGELVHRLLTDVGFEAEGAIADHLDRLGTRIGEVRYNVRFPNPLNTELRG